jgi:flagellar protein FlbT
MQAEDASTPLKQLYFAIQAMLISPNDCEAALQLCREMLVALNSTVRDSRILAGLRAAIAHIEEKRMFEALKDVRALFPIEEELVLLAKSEATRDVA